MRNLVHTVSDKNQLKPFLVTQKFATMKIMHEKLNSSSFSFIDKYNIELVYNLTMAFESR